MNSSISRSSFVTAVAWVFITISGFGTLISILQNIMVQTMFTGPEFEQALQAPPAPGAPPFAVFFLTHFRLFFALFLLATAATFVISVGLLKRKNWARLAFIGLMVLGIAWNLGGLVLQFSVLSSVQDSFANAPPEAPNMKVFFIAMAVVSVLFALGFSGLFGWIAKRLMSPAIAAEFSQ